jgi:WD40 repeat protein
VLGWPGTELGVSEVAEGPQAIDRNVPEAIALRGMRSCLGSLRRAHEPSEGPLYEWLCVFLDDGAVTSAQFSADGQRVVTTSSEKTVGVWDAATGKALSEPMKYHDWVNYAQPAPPPNTRLLFVQ